MEDVISEAKAEFLRARDRVKRALTNTHDDKLNWSPSATARTPLQIGAHVAISMPTITMIIDGKPFPSADVAQADAAGREVEKQYTTREQVFEMLDKSAAGYVAWLDALAPNRLNSTAQLPFGSLPMPIAITLMADHLRGHACQIDYIQTVYGDHEWYM